MKTFFSILVFFVLTSLQAKTIYFVPMNGYPAEKFFFDPYSFRDEMARPFCRLREELEKAGYRVKFTTDAKNMEDFTALISFNESFNMPQLMENLHAYPKERCFLCLIDPPGIIPWSYDKSLPLFFGKIFTMWDEDIDHKSYFRFNFPQPRLKMVDNVPDFYQKKLCVMIANNLNLGQSNELIYSERRKVAAFFEKRKPRGELDIYGKFGWGSYRNWKGSAKSKWAVYKNYRFAFCYENTCRQKGYVTEKIFDCFNGGCVPIYLGAENIADYVPTDCFIDRRKFSSEKELYLFLKNMDKVTYENYLSSIRKYLESPQAYQFSTEYFVKMILESLLE